MTQLSGAIHQESKVDKFVFYPYKFGSIFKEKVWGGRGLNLFLHKDLPPHAMVGESWELSDRDADMSIVENGPHRGVSLRSLMTANPASLLGEDVARAFPHRFPLLVKYIDAHETLSLQVHPDDAHAMRNENGQWGKMEAWYIIHAAPGAFIYRGVVPGTDRRRFEDMLLRRTVRDCLVKLPVNTGDLVFVPPGCLHATGRGVLFYQLLTGRLLEESGLLVMDDTTIAGVGRAYRFWQDEQHNIKLIHVDKRVPGNMVVQKSEKDE